MAAVNIVIGQIKNVAQGGPAIIIEQSQDITSTASNIQSTISAESNLDFAQVTVDGSTAIYVAIGANADATTTPRARILAGQTRDFSLKKGDLVAVVDA